MGSSLFSSRSSQLPLHSQQLTLPPLLVVCTVPLVLNPPPHLLHPLPLPLLPPLPPFRTLPSSLPSVSALLRWLIVMNMLVSPGTAAMKELSTVSAMALISTPCLHNNSALA